MRGDERELTLDVARPEGSAIRRSVGIVLRLPGGSSAPVKSMGSDERLPAVELLARRDRPEQPLPLEHRPADVVLAGHGHEAWQRSRRETVTGSSLQVTS